MCDGLRQGGVSLSTRLLSYSLLCKSCGLACVMDTVRLSSQHLDVLQRPFLFAELCLTVYRFWYWHCIFFKCSFIKKENIKKKTDNKGKKIIMNILKHMLVAS